jgi:hypothetical protein
MYLLKRESDEEELVPDLSNTLSPPKHALSGSSQRCLSPYELGFITFRYQML